MIPASVDYFTAKGLLSIAFIVGLAVAFGYIQVRYLWFPKKEAWK